MSHSENVKSVPTEESFVSLEAEFHARLAEVKASRKAIGRDVSNLANELNFAKKAAEAVRRKPFAWVGSATFGGYLFSRILFKDRRKKPKKGKGKAGAVESGAEQRKEEVRSLTLWGFLLGAFRVALPLLKPALSAYASRRLSNMIELVGREK